MMRFERLRTSVDPTHTPRTSIIVGLLAVPFGAAFTAACRLEKVFPLTVTVQTLLSRSHVVPAGWKRSAGQLGPLPGQFSATSHWPADARHTWVVGAKA